MADSTINMAEGNNIEQKGNFGLGHMDWGKIEGNVKVAGQLEENNNNQSQNININVNTNNVFPAKSNISVTPPNNNQQEKLLFEIKISGELIRDNKAEYAEYKSKKKNWRHCWWIKRFKDESGVQVYRKR